MTKLLLSRKLQNMSESATIGMAQKARDLKSKGIDIISLSLGEPDFETPKYIIDAAKKALDDGITKYTPVSGAIKLKKAICHKLKRDNKVEYQPSQVVVSNGAKQSIANVCLSLLDPGDEVIIFAPYWVSYFEIVKFAGGTPVIIYAGIEDDYKVKPEQLSAAINDKTKLIIYSSPSNPTGSVYSQLELDSIAQVIAEHENIFVLSDEIYEFISFNMKSPSIANCKDMYDRSILVNGMSKGYAMTGWRIGYMAAPEWICNACTKVQGQFTSGANSFGQYAAAIALTEDPSAQNYMTEKYHERKQLVWSLLNDIDGIKCNDPQGAFYFFPNVSDLFGRSNGKRTINNADELSDILLNEAHVGTVSGSAFGDPNSIRISYATSAEKLIEAMSRIKNTLQDYH